jgi:protein involved in polysaccharide export with SLBB domain
MKRTAGQSIRCSLASKRPADLLFATLVLLSVPLLLTSQISCASTGAAAAPTYGFIEPPKAELAASLAQDKIKASDVIQVKFPDGSKVSATQTLQVAPDGTVEISGRGKVQVAGKTLQQAQEAIQTATAVSGAVEQAIQLAMNEYYLVTVDDNGVKHFTRVPIKGEPRVRDALAKMKLSDKIIWITRPDPSRYLRDQVLPVDWESIAHDPNNRTNYPLQPGDWLIVANEPSKGLARVYNAVSGMATAPSIDRSDLK